MHLYIYIHMCFHSICVCFYSICLVVVLVYVSVGYVLLYRSVFYHTLIFCLAPVIPATAAVGHLQLY